MMLVEVNMILFCVCEKIYFYEYESLKNTRVHLRVTVYTLLE